MQSHQARRTRYATFALFAALFAVGLLLGTVAFAQYPNKPVTYTIPFNPGGESDVTARLQQEGLEEILGVDIVIQNQDGGGGAVGWSEFQRSAQPDGYRIISVNLPHIIAQPASRADAGYTSDGFEPLYWFHFTPNMLVVQEDSEFQTLEEFIAFGKENPQVLTIGGSGTLSANHLETLRLENAAEVDLTYIPFTGSAPTYPAVLGGHVSALMSYSTTPFAVDGVRALAVASEERLPFLPDVPTFRELGYDIVGGAYRGLAVPNDTPQEVKDTLVAAFDTVTNDISAQQSELGYLPTYISGEEAVAVVEEVRQNYQEIIEAQSGN